jgi:hypothetical protein
MVRESPPVNSSNQEEYSVDGILPGTRVTLDEFARIIGVTYQTALAYKKKHFIRTFQIGGRFFVYQEELNRFLREGNLTPEQYEDPGGES